MSKRIGERLLDRGLITRGQLDKALKAQLIMGGHLGTTLIELGFVEERTLAEMLAEMHRVKPVTAEMLVDISIDVLGVIPPSMAERHRVIPLSVQDRTLDLAVIEPRSVPPISAVAGVKKIVPWIAPEFRVLEALETYYGVPRRPRYLKLCQELDRARERPAASPGAATGSTGSAEVAAAQPLPSARSGRGTDSPALATTTEIGEEYGYGKSWREIARDLFDGADDEEPPAERPRAAVRGRETRKPAERGSTKSLDEAARRISRVQNKDQLGAAVLDYFAARTAGSILFTVRNEAARIWDWRGHGFSPDRVRELRFPVTDDSVFTLLLGNSYYLGPVPDEKGSNWFFDALQIEPPAEIFLAPVHLNDRLVAILYADAGPQGTLPDEAEDYLRIARKLSLALNVLILKMKILGA
jgi:hypothetical protein